MSIEKQPAATDMQTQPAKSDVSDRELEQVSGGTVGSQSTGAGAGKVTFNPFSITRKVDKASPVLF